MYNTIELFAGTKSFSKVSATLGHNTFTTDYEEIDGQDLVADINNLTTVDFPYTPDVLWASPPCEGFSVAAIGKNWGGGYRGYVPKSDTARRSINLVEQTNRLISELKPKWWFIENPRGLLRKLDLIPTGG
jgi:site-specific DNA-cytosine methylase